MLDIETNNTEKIDSEEQPVLNELEKMKLESYEIEKPISNVNLFCNILNVVLIGLSLTGSSMLLGSLLTYYYLRQKYE